MAWYKYSKFLESNTHANFDTIHAAGAAPPDSGIFRCEGCSKEISHTKGSTLPPQNHHQHTASQGTVRWRMIVCAQTDG